VGTALNFLYSISIYEKYLLRWHEKKENITTYIKPPT